MEQRVELPPIRQQFKVAFNYDVHFTSGLFVSDNPLLANTIQGEADTPSKMLVVVDSGVMQCHRDLVEQIEAYAQAYKTKIELVGHPIPIPGGEQCKNTFEYLDLILKKVNDLGVCRHSYILVIGGGAILDMVGYAAALAHRGIRLIRVPTTVLGQCDSGVGVKNGINAFGKKNFLGTFVPPCAVLNDFDFLTTLEDRDWRSGIAEAIKVALIKDSHFFDYIENNAALLSDRDMPIGKQVIYRCAQMHLEHISGNDPFENGSSRPLDFGHWSAHKLEQLTKHGLRHGEAVAIGIALDSVYSHLSGMLSNKELERILKTLETLGFQLYVPEMLDYAPSSECYPSLFAGLKEFQEHLGGPLTLMLLKGIGKGVNVHQVQESLYLRAIHLLKER